MISILRHYIIVIIFLTGRCKIDITWMSDSWNRNTPSSSLSVDQC